MAKFALAIGSQKSRLAVAVAAVPLLAPKMALFKNDIVPTPSNVLADFTEADFTGYAQQSPVFGAVVIDENGIPVAPASSTFTASGSAITNTVYGMYLLDSTGALVGAARFDSPRGFANLGDFEIVTLLFGLTDATISTAVGP